jgi:hypothetical protein
MSRRQLKKVVLAILQKEGLEEVFHDLERYRDHRLINPLFIALCHPVERVRWHAVCSFGWLVPVLAEKNLEAGRIVMRRFLWSLNDESGGIGWGGPEAMAEIMCYSSPLRKEYLHMLISYMREDGEALFQDGNYLELPLLQRGLLWGIGRLSQDHCQEMKKQLIVGDVSAYLNSPDKYVAGLAIWTLGLLGAAGNIEEIYHFQDDNEELCLFLNKKFHSISIAQLVRNALQAGGENKNLPVSRCNS